ncbi:MAG: DUF4382 domain-containing protein [Pseudomonadales bacterium]|jgi:hypothetical protein|nr:DUF4382 domain-containing protein [Pseudomonadales bacterium]
MKLFRFPRVLATRSLAALAVAGLLTACGGGGGSSSSPSSPTSPAPSPAPGGGTTTGTGTVGVTIADAPTDQYSSIEIDVTRVELVPDDDDDDRVVLFDDPDGLTIDLLQLDTTAQVLVEGVVAPSGEYEGIVLFVEEIRLHPVGGGDAILARVPANGRVFLNPRGEFDLDDDEYLLVQLDIDANKSFKITTAGNSGQVIFRPVVFVDVYDDDDRDDARGRFGFLSGSYGPGGDALGGTFELCGILPLRRDDDDDDDDEVGSADPERCLLVQTSDDTLFVDDTGSVISFDALRASTQDVVVGGRLVPADGGPVFRAALVDEGARQSFRSFEGEVEGSVQEGVLLVDPDDDDLFDDDVFDDDFPVPVTLLEGALIFSKDGRRLAPSALRDDDEVRVFGLATDSDDTDELPFDGFTASAVAVDDDDDDDDREDFDDDDREGDILSFADGRLEVERDDGEGSFCAIVGDMTDIKVFLDDDDGAFQTESSTDDLVPGYEVEVFGPLDGECFDAQLILVETDDRDDVRDDDEEFDGDIVELDVEAGTLTLELDNDGAEQCVVFSDDTFIEFDFDDGPDQLAAPEDLELGQDVDVYGSELDDAGCVVAEVIEIDGDDDDDD